MYLATSEIPNVIHEYIQTVIVPKAGGKGLLAMIGFAIGGAGLAKGISNMIEQYIPVGQSLSIIDQDKKIELTDLKARLDNALKLAGGTLPVLGGAYNLDQADINALVQIAEKHGVP